MSLAKAIRPLVENGLRPMPRTRTGASPERRWLIVLAAPGRETTLVAYLEAYRYRHYLPMIIVEEKRGRAMQSRIAPMFPGYVFLHIDLALEHHHRIGTLPGVRTIDQPFLSFGGELAELTDQAVQWIRCEECRIVPLHDEVEALGSGKPKPRFRKGEKVEIVKGPLAGSVGEIERLDSLERITVLMRLLGRASPVTLAASSLKAI